LQLAFELNEAGVGQQKSVVHLAGRWQVNPLLHSLLAPPSGGGEQALPSAP